MQPWRKPDDAAAGGRSQARYWHGALRHRQASCQQRACFASPKISRFVTPTIPPTGADANDFYRVSAPNVVPFVVTNRTGKRNRASGSPVIRSSIAACHAADCWPSAKTLAFKVTGRFAGVLPVCCAHRYPVATATAMQRRRWRRPINCRKRFQCRVHREITSATAAAGLLIWPNPPPGAVNVVLLRRLHIDSGGVSALLLLGFGFGESKAKGFVSPNLCLYRL
jgi:hypothetical protein